MMASSLVLYQQIKNKICRKPQKRESDGCYPSMVRIEVEKGRSKISRRECHPPRSAMQEAIFGGNAALSSSGPPPCLGRLVACTGPIVVPAKMFPFLGLAGWFSLVHPS